MGKESNIPLYALKLHNFFSYINLYNESLEQTIAVNISPDNKIILGFG